MDEYLFSRTFCKQNSPASEGKLNPQKKEKKLISEKEDWLSIPNQKRLGGMILGSESDSKILNIITAEEISFHKGIFLISNFIALPKEKKAVST